MGVMRKLAFWKKSKTSHIKPFEAPGEETDAEEVTVKADHDEGAGAVEEEASQRPLSPEGSPSVSLAELSPKGAAPASAAASPKSAAASPAAAEQAVAPEASLAAAAEANDSGIPAGSESPPPPEVEPPTRQSPSPPPAAAKEDSLNFDLPPEVVNGKIGEAFGQMVAASLQNSKWDKRAQALKAVSSVLKGLEMQGRSPPGSTAALGKGLRLHDRTACWRTGCLLLNQALRDKVIPIRLAALELFLDTFASCTVSGLPKAEVSHALDVLVEHIIDRLGDSNLRLHEGARKCLLFAAERNDLLGLKPALLMLSARLSKAGRSGERAKVHFGILDAVNFLLQHFPGSRGGGHIDDDLDDDEADAPHAPEDSWTQGDIAPFIIAGMDDSLGPRVRDCAAALAVTVYQTFGMEVMKPTLAALRPAKQALLKQKFEEFEGFDPEEGEGDEEGPELRPADLEGLVICGSAIKPQQPPGAASSKAAAPPPLPGCVNVDYDEEFVMDGILEDAGCVFSGTGMVGEALAAAASSSQRLPPGFLTNHLGLTGMDLDEDDHRFLEEELVGMGLGDIEGGIDEQQALLLSLQESQGIRNRGMSVEVF